MKKFHSGFVALIGRPNVGKSTLMNCLIGEKIAITSHKPQTTRNKITSILTKDDFQCVFLDTPGIHKPKSKLGEYMMKSANDRTLILIDEFGTGTEPQIGGAIAEAVLKQFCIKRAYGVITTHYQNLKHFADSHEGVVNGAMLYDRHQMQALFQLQIGQPGSSFAIEKPAR